MSKQGGGKGGGGGKGDHAGREQGRSAAEWMSLGISAVIVLALLGLVTYQQLARGSRPATIEVAPRLGAVRQVGGAYYVPVEITNRGDLVAEDVRVRLVHSSDGARQQSSELGVDYLAGGEAARGMAVFREDPSGGWLEVEMLSFLEP